MKPKKQKRTSNQINNWDSILDKFKDHKSKKCFRCKKKLKKPIDCGYIYPNIYCQKCFKIVDKENLKALDVFDEFL